MYDAGLQLLLSIAIIKDVIKFGIRVLFIIFVFCERENFENSVLFFVFAKYLFTVRYS